MPSLTSVFERYGPWTFGYMSYQAKYQTDHQHQSRTHQPTLTNRPTPIYRHESSN